MLRQNPNNIIKPPIYYVNWTTISVENNYTTTKKHGFGYDPCSQKISALFIGK
jgi:hypothetical protein